MLATAYIKDITNHQPKKRYAGNHIHQIPVSPAFAAKVCKNGGTNTIRTKYANQRNILLSDFFIGTRVFAMTYF